MLKGSGAVALAEDGFEDVVAADAGQTVGGEVEGGVATKDGECLTAGGIDHGAHVDGFAKVVGQGGTGGFPKVVVAFATGHIG